MPFIILLLLLISFNGNGPLSPYINSNSRLGCLADPPHKFNAPPYRTMTLMSQSINKITACLMEEYRPKLFR